MRLPGRIFWLVMSIGAVTHGALGQRLQLTEPATASTFPKATCGDPFAPTTGKLNISGVVGYQLDSAGRPDTASVRVLEIEFLSVAGFRSAVVRRLARCRMTLPFGYQGGPIPVRQAVEFIETGFLPASASRLDSLPTGMLVEAVPIPADGLPFPLDDSRLEEHPLQDLGCRPPPPSAAGQRFRSREEAMRAADEMRRRTSGTVVIQVTVDVDGRVIPGSDSLVMSANPLSTDAMIASLMQCRFHPARIGGVPVPAKALARVSVITEPL